MPDRAARDGAPGTTTPRGEVAPRLPARVAALRGHRVPEAGPAALRVLGAARARLRRRRGRVMKYFSYVQDEFQQVFLNTSANMRSFSFLFPMTTSNVVHAFAASSSVIREVALFSVCLVRPFYRILFRRKVRLVLRALQYTHCVAGLPTHDVISIPPSGGQHMLHTTACS